MKSLDGQEQLFDILQSYFRNAATYYPDPANAGSTTYFSKVGMDFIDESACVVSRLKPTSPLVSRNIILLQSLTSGLRDLREDAETSPPPDYLFFASFAYVNGLVDYESDSITTQTGRDLILAILQYRERIVPQKDVQDGLYDSQLFDNNWSSFVDCARELGIIVSSPDEKPPADLAPLEAAEIQEGSDHPSGDAVVEILHDHSPSTSSSSDTDSE